jgi:hypothetical protein
MAEVVGGPIDLRICENCPKRDHNQDLHVSTGRAKVVVNEKGLRGVYATSDGKSAGHFYEHSTSVYMEDPAGCDGFVDCDGPVKDTFLQKIGFTAASCPALENLVAGDPTNGDIIAEYLEINHINE